MRKMATAVWACLPVLLLTLGCGPAKDPNQKETAPVTVTVTLDGKPVEGALVTFIQPAPGNPPAAGRTGADGVAKMMTYATDDGAVLGQHNVQVTKVEGQPTAAAADQDTAAYDPNAVPVATRVKHLIPEKYSVAGRSGLTAEVKKGANDFKFELKSK